MPHPKPIPERPADRKARLMVDLLAPLLARRASLKEMAAYLTEHRVLTPSGRGIVWSHQTVDYLLRRAGVERRHAVSPIGRCRRP